MVLVYLMFLVKMVKNGIMIESIVSVLQGQNGMAKDVFLVVAEKLGLHLRDVYVPQALSFQVLDVKR